jgi:hypothetical protein
MRGKDTDSNSVKFSKELKAKKFFLTRYNPEILKTRCEEYETLRDSLIEHSRHFEEVNSRKIAVLEKSETLHLSEERELATWFDNLKDECRKTLLASIRSKFGITLNDEDILPELIRLDLVENEYSFQSAIEIDAYNKGKGYLWEWLILCVLMTGAPVRNRSNQTICFRPSPRSGTEISVDGESCWLWYQKSIKATRSKFSAKPDFLIVRSPAQPSPDNILAMIECKNVKRLSSGLVRQAAGTSYDLKVNTVLIANADDVKQTFIKNASRIGVTVMKSPLSGLQRADYLTKKLKIGDYLREKIETAYKERAFLRHEERRIHEVLGKDRQGAEF